MDKGNENGINTDNNTSALPLLHSSLLFYLNNLSSDNKNQIASSLLAQFIVNKARLRLNKLQSIILAKAKKTKQLYLNKWSNKSFSKYRNTFSNYTIKNKQNKKESILSSPNDNFILRQQHFTQQVKKLQDQRLLESEDEFSLICTFAPMTNNYFKSKDGNNFNKGKNAYVRLYDDSQRRTEANSKRQYDNTKNNKSSTKQMNIRWNNTNSNMNTINKTKKNIANEKMHNYHKIYKKKKANLQKEKDQERGMGFKPEVKSSAHYGSPDSDKKTFNFNQFRRYYECLQNNNGNEEHNSN